MANKVRLCGVPRRRFGYFAAAGKVTRRPQTAESLAKKTKNIGAMMMPYKVAFVSLGCAKNLVNTEQMMALCRDAGYTVTGEPEGADVAVLNTLSLIHI